MTPPVALLYVHLRKKSIKIICTKNKQLAIHDDTSFKQFVIPDLTRNPVFFWIPAGVYPVLDTGQE